MSTDDLTRRAREAIAGYALYGTPALVSELADEVDQLREAESGLWRDVEIYAAERDAARAALERVRAIGAVIADECAHHEDREGETPALRVSGGWRDVSDYAQDITRALEGKPA